MISDACYVALVLAIYLILAIYHSILGKSTTGIPQTPSSTTIHNAIATKSTLLFKLQKSTTNSQTSISPTTLVCRPPHISILSIQDLTIRRTKERRSNLLRSKV